MSGFTKEQLQAVARIIQAQPAEDVRAGFVKLDIRGGDAFWLPSIRPGRKFSC